MRLATYRTPDGVSHAGIVDDGRVVELDAAARAAGLPTAGGDLVAYIESLDAAAWTRLNPADLPGEPVDEAQWRPPIPRPSKILGVAINNGTAVRAASFIADVPSLFTYPPSALVGHGEPIVIRKDYGVTHPEAELGVVIGREAKDVAPEDALDIVFGYTIVNDITSVDLKSENTVVYEADATALVGGQKADGTYAGFEHGRLQLTYHARSKGTDTFAPAGPWIVTKDEIADPNRLAVRLYMNGKLCTEDSTANLVHSAAQVISHASRYFTLYPGDIVHLGTAIVGDVRLRDVDFQTLDGPCEIEIEGVGRLVNPVVRED